jgi:hypothetical protein
MKKIVAVAAAAVTLATASTALAANGTGSGTGLADHLAKLDAKITKIAEKCSGPTAPAKCASAKDKISAKLDQLAAKLQDKLATHPNSKKLQSALDEITTLKSHL